jgi:hypothetical protein
MSQRIEGGMQVRLTPTGFPKLTAAVDQNFPTVACVAPQTFGAYPLTVTACDAPDCPGGVVGCPVFLYWKSGDRPASATFTPPTPPPAANQDDGKNLATYSLDPAGPAIVMKRTFDAFAPIHVTLSGLTSGTCYLYASDAHIGNDGADPLQILARIGMGIDPATGELGAALSNVDLTPGPNVTGCGAFGAAVSTYVSGLESTVKGAIVNLLTPQLDAAVQAFLPKPAGAVGRVNLPPALASYAPYAPPANEDLEYMAVLGGYVSAPNSGLSVGVIAGMNSDRQLDGGAASEPSACVTGGAVPDLGAPPVNLGKTARGAFLLHPADAFMGAPDPNTDVLLGISQAFLGLAAAHVVNSGALCLSVGGATLPSLTSGALSVLLDSTGTVNDDRRAVLTAVVHPTVPQVKLGSGTPADPLVHVAFHQLGFDLNLAKGSGGDAATKSANVFSATFDLDAAFDLGTSPIASDRPGLQPLLSSTSVSNVSVSIAKGAIVADSGHLEGVVRSIAGVIGEIVAGPFAGPAPLPSFGTFALDDVTFGPSPATSESAFLALAANIVPLTAATAIETTATLDVQSIPDEAHLRALYDSPAASNAVGPRVTLNLGPRGSEFSWRIDGSAWRPWATNLHPAVADDALLLQGSHTLDVRARVPGQWRTEDLTPVHLEFVVDSVPPELHPKLSSGASSLDFGGFDLVTPDGGLLYAWNDASGKPTAFTSSSAISVSDALAITNGGSVPIVILAKDQAGNVGQISFDLKAALAGVQDGGGGGGGGPSIGTGGGAFSEPDSGATDGGADGGFSARDSSGCGCSLAARPERSMVGWFAALGLIAWARRRARAERVPRIRGTRTRRPTS